MRNFLVVILSLLLTVQVFSQGMSRTEDPKQPDVGLFSKIKRENIIGRMLKEYLEKYHYRKMTINDDLSKKAFKLFLEKLDFSKQFLLEEDIKKLRTHRMTMDDQMKSGNYEIVNMAKKIKEKRIKKAEALRKAVFKKQFDFSTKESIELDPEKREFAAKERDFNELWRKTFKQSTLSRYTTLLDDQKSLKKDIKKQKNKKEKKKLKEKILSEKEILAKAHDLTSKKYKRFFERQLQEERMDYLERFYNSVSEIFDPHTSYMAPKKKEDFDIDMSGSLEGIGAVLSEEEGYIKVVKVVPGGAAWRQKDLKVDDLILAVGEGEGAKDPVDLVGMRVGDAVRYIRGKKGTTVRLYVKKSDGTRKMIPIKRDVVKIGESFAKSSVLELKPSKRKIGYIHVPKFYREFKGGVNCTDDVRNEIRRLKKQKVSAMILDLRNNGGGALEDAKQMSGLFIEKGPIVQIKNHMHNIEVLQDNDSSIEYDGPLIVMINRFSASASEILAGAMQDYGRAVIVGGENSHGKGTVQAVLSLDDVGFASMIGQKLGALKVTIQKFYRINGDSTQYKGITPDIILPDPYSYIENREQDLDYSLPWDKVKAKSYKTWNKHSIDLKSLRKKSDKRVKKNKRIEKIVERVTFLKKRKNETKVSLNLKEWQEDEKTSKDMLEKFNDDTPNTKLKVSHFEESLKSHENVKASDEKQWKEDFKQRKKEWVETLQKDPLLEEAINIAEDMVDMLVGNKQVYVRH